MERLSESIPKQKRPCFGLNFEEAVSYSRKVPCTTTINDSSKLSFSANLTLDFHTNSYQYDNEAVLTAWNYEYPHIEKRSSNQHFGRMELVLPISCETRDFFLACAYEVDARLKGVK